jgi:hypothetical protein
LYKRFPSRVLIGPMVNNVEDVGEAHHRNKPFDAARSTVL